MSNFVTDGTALPFPKADLGGKSGPSINNLTAPEWNTVCQAMEDLRAALLSGIHPPLLFPIWTDSNGMGAGTRTDQDDPADSVSTPNANVVFQKIFTSNFAEPVTPTIMPVGSLRIQAVAPDPAHGPELMIGYWLNAIINGPGSTPDAAHKIWLAQFSIHSSTMAQWQHGSSAGTSSPLLGGGNLDDDSNNQTLTAAAASGRLATCAFTMLGTNDCSNGTDAGNLGTNMTAFFARKRAIHGNQLMFVCTVIQSTITNPPFPNLTTGRANQIAAILAAPGVAIVYAEDLATIDDFAHFTSVSEQILGTRQAFAFIRMAGLVQRIVTAPTVVGVSQATYNGSAHGLSGFTGASGSTIRALPWQGSADLGASGRDLIFIPVFAGFIGAGSTIATPTGYTLAATQISSTDAGGVGNQVGLFMRQVLQGDLDTNPPSTGGPGFPTSVTVTPGGAQFVCKPFTVRAPPGVGYPAFDDAAVAFTHTAADTADVTAAGVTTTAANRTVFVLVTGWSAVGQTFNVVNAGLAGLTQVFGAAYPSSSGNYLYVGLWQGTKVAAGATGNSTVSRTLNASCQGYTWAM